MIVPMEGVGKGELAARGKGEDSILITLPGAYLL